MFEAVTTQKQLKSLGMRSTLLAAAFLFAQLLISFHHVGDAHGLHDSDNDFSVECEVCTVSAGIFDSPFAAAVVPDVQPFQTPAIVGIESSLPPTGDRLHPPRAPPLNS